jgi:hypothetical protein
VTTNRHRELLGLLLLVALAGCDKQAGLRPGVEEPVAEAMGKRPAQAQIEAVEADVRKMQSALYGGDYQTVVAMTNPEVLSAYDTTPEQAAAEIEAAMSDMQDAGVELELLTFPEDPTFFSSGQHDFVLVPTLSAFKIGGQRVESRAFLLGVKPRGGQGWTYVAGEHFEEENVLDLFPDYPPDRLFPETYKRRL